MNIVWLCSWYPNKIDAFRGDFIQRQAKACSSFHTIHVYHLYECHDDVLPVAHSTQVSHQLKETVEYLRKGKLKIISILKWMHYHRKFIKQYISEHGKPDLVHVQIPIQAGLFALYLKLFYGIPSIVTEHYGIYNKAVQDSIHTRNWLFKFLTNQIIKQANLVTTVSRSLGEEMNGALKPFPFEVIPNVVNTDLFHFTEPLITTPAFRFLHVSNMIALKNVRGILEAILELKKKNTPVELHLVGALPQDEIEFAKQHNVFNSVVFFKGEIPYHEVVREMQQSHAHVIFSNSETQSCVVLESLCCGRPAIVTNVGGVKELISNENGFLVEPGNVDDLVSKMEKMMVEYYRFDFRHISKQAIEQYSYDSVGEKFSRIYESIKK